jgi:hypothetical protein
VEKLMEAGRGMGRETMEADVADERQLKQAEAR